jgi:membrane protease YdiL (CAAX protease family)
MKITDRATETDAWRTAPTGSSPTIAVTWALTLAVSTLPHIVALEVFHAAPLWIPVVQVASALALLLASLLIPRLRPMWRFCMIMALLVAVLATVSGLDIAGRLQDVLGSDAFGPRMLAEQTLKLGIAGLMIAALLVLGYRRRQFFLTVGRLDAPMRPVRLLGFPRADPWRRFALIWGFGIAIVLGTILFVSAKPSGADFIALVPLLPVVVIAAASNAFAEEMTYRAPMLSTLEPAVGSAHALWQAAVFFGVAHYFGIPGGLIGAASSVFMGWILGKAMLETRGLFWAWFIHFLSDVVIFSSVAVALA